MSDDERYDPPHAIRRQMQKITHVTLNEQARMNIRESLMSGVFGPGEVLTIRGLAAELGISATPIREALKTLVAEGVLVTLPNRSIAVPVMTREQFQELRMIRVALEGLCVELAAPRIGAGMLQTLEAQHREMAAAVESGNVREYMRLNEAFHLNIYRAAERDTLLGYIENLWLRVGPYMTLLFKPAGFYGEATQAHGRILAALTARDGAAAREAVQHDINAAAQHLLAQFDA